MKNISLLFAFLILSLGVFAQAAPDASTLKSEIKSLEKAVKDEEKAISRLEKDLAKIRPDAEQAQRDAKNISDMRTRKQAEFDAFSYDKKSAELKSLKKESKKASKNLSKTIKSQKKLDSQIKKMDQGAADQGKAVSEQEKQISHLEGKLSHYSAEEKLEMQMALKSKEPVDPELLQKATAFKADQDQLKEAQKAISKEEKAHSKANSKLDKSKSQVSDLGKDEAAFTSQAESLERQVKAKEDELKTMDPKAVKKELANLQKQATQAEATHEKLNSELMQQQKIIDEKHNILEVKKQEIREKQSVLDKL